MDQRLHLSYRAEANLINLVGSATRMVLQNLSALCGRIQPLNGISPQGESRKLDEDKT